MPVNQPMRPDTGNGQPNKGVEQIGPTFTAMGHRPPAGVNHAAAVKGQVSSRGLGSGLVLAHCRS
jgi:hypothetical protein